MSGHYGRDCREMWWSEEKATGKGSAESGNWEEGRLGGISQSYREQDEKWTDSLKFGERQALCALSSLDGAIENGRAVRERVQVLMHRRRT